MIELTGFDSSGRIVEVISASDGDIADINKRKELSYLEGRHDYLETYILNGQPTERPASPVTLHDLTLQGVPTGSTLMINGERYDADGDVELEFPLPGGYRLRVECFPYRDWEGEVVV